MKLIMFRGDGVEFTIPLSWEGVPYLPQVGEVLIFTVKRTDADPDTQAIIQKTTGVGLSTSGTDAVVEIVHEDTVDLAEGLFGVFDVQAQVPGDSPRTLHKGLFLVRLDTTQGTSTSVPIYTAHPPANVGADYVDAQVGIERARAMGAEQALQDAIDAIGGGGGGVAGVSSVNGRSGAVVLTKSDVGLSSVDNTADASKPVSTAQAAAIAAAQAAAQSASRPASWVPAWGDITGKPVSFTPSAHTHLWADLTDKPVSFTPSAHTHPWSEVTGKPATFPPDSHTHAYSSLTGLPTLFDGTWGSLSGKPTFGYFATGTDAANLTGSLGLARFPAGTGLQVLRRSADNLSLEFATISAGGGDMLKSENLSGLTNYVTARSNLGLGSAATQPSSAFAAASHTHAQSEVTNLVSDLAAKAPLASPTFTGTVKVGDAAGVGALTVDGPAGTTKHVNWKDAGISRWSLSLQTDNSISFQRRDAAGAYVDGPLSISPGTGIVACSKGMTVGGNTAAAWLYVNGAAGEAKGLYLQDAGVTRWRLFQGTTNDLVFSQNDASGAFLRTPLTINSGGNATFVGTVVAPTLYASTEAIIDRGTGLECALRFRNSAVNRFKLATHGTSGDFQFTRYSDDGTVSNLALTVARNDGAVSINTSLTVAGTNVITALDAKQATLANASTLAKITESAGAPLWNGAAWPGGSGSGMANPMTTVGQLITSGVAGAPEAVAAAQVVGGAQLFTNPATGKPVLMPFDPWHLVLGRFAQNAGSSNMLKTDAKAGVSWTSQIVTGTSSGGAVNMGSSVFPQLQMTECNEIIIDAIVRFETIPTVANDPFQIITFCHTSNGLTSGRGSWELGIDFNQTTGCLRSYIRNNAVNYYGATESAPLVAGQFYHLRTRLWRSDGDLDGQIDRLSVYVDGTLLSTETVAGSALVASGMTAIRAIRSASVAGANTINIHFIAPTSRNWTRLRSSIAPVPSF